MLSRMQRENPEEFEAVVVKYLLQGEDTVNLLHTHLITKKETVSSLMRNLEKWGLRNLLRHLFYMKFKCDEPCD